MAPLREEKHLANAVIAYMGEIAEQKSSRYVKKLAGSSELTAFLLYLSENAPSAMHKVLRSVTRKCGYALRDEKESRDNRKRACPTDSKEKNTKRFKVTYATEQETVRQTAVDDEEELVTKDSDELQSEATTYAGQEVDTTVPPTKYEVQSGLTKRCPRIEAFVKAALLSLEPSITRPNFNIDDEIAMIWNIIPLLEFYKTRRELHQHLESREKMPAETSQALTNWDISEPSEILDALENIQRSTTDNKIHRAYGQTMLFTSVNARVSSGYKATVNGHKSDHTALLEELARKKAGSISKTEIDGMIASYISEYHMGQKWLAVMDWFDGSGIVLIFVIAGLGSWKVKSWTEFQRSCVQHIAGFLDSIRELVKTLGPDALDRYCKHGRLGNDCLDRVKEARFTQPDTDEESEDDAN